MSKKQKSLDISEITLSTQILHYIRGMSEEERLRFINELLQEPYEELDGNTSYLEAYYNYDFEKWIYKLSLVLIFWNFIIFLGLFLIYKLNNALILQMDKVLNFTNQVAYISFIVF